MTQLIDPEAFKERLERISELFAGMVVHADEQAKQRCPYKDRRDQCTAKFDCRNQRPGSQPGNLQLCAAQDDQLDYRSAWETLGPEKAAALRDKLRR
ncbi:MAG: hypothetical protein EXS58_12640 [Candidatus Latescibacteria bacterium]|nr:hypothetical protein [Candidatus Latescibacterota bacterium]